MLKKQGLATGLGDEGGFAPNLPANVAALELISTAVQSTGLTLGSDIALALDVASTEFFDAGTYTFEGTARSAEEMTAIYEQWIADFPIVSIEDPLAEDDWAGWTALVSKIGDKIQVVGDDLFVTNVTRLQRGIVEKAASALLVKVNQIGSLTETLDAVDLHTRWIQLHDEPPFRRDRGHHHRRSCSGDQLRPDQVWRSGAYGPSSQVQPAAANRGGSRRRSPLRWRLGIPEVQGLASANRSAADLPPRRRPWTGEAASS